MAKKTGKQIGVWIIFGLLFVGLIGFGSAGLNGGLRSLGKVGDKEIMVSDYANALNGQLNQFSQQMGQNLSFIQAQSFGLPQAVLGQLVANRALDNEATEIGLSAGDVHVNDRIVRQPAFAGLDGSFDPEGYAYALRTQGQTVGQFEATVRDEIARNILEAAVVGGTGEQPTYVDTLLSYIGERRSFTWATLTADALEGDLPAPTEDDARAYFDANPLEFTAPESRQISYAWVTPTMLIDQVTVTDEEIAQQYEQRIAEFVSGERRLVERLIYPDQTAAEAAIASLSDEVTFETLAEARGLRIEDTDLGDVAQNQLGAAGEGVFAAEPGDVVGPFQTNLGPALFRMNAVLQAQETTLEEASDGIRDQLADGRARRLIQGMGNDITDLVAGGATLEDIAERTELVMGQIDWSVEATDGIAAYESFRANAVGLTENAFPEVVELSDGGLFVARLDGITPPTLRPFDDVSEAATQARAAEATQEAIADQTATLITSLATNGSFEDLGLDATTEVNLIRREFVAGTPPGFMETVFGMSPGDVTTAELPEGMIIVRLDEVADYNADDATIEAEREAIAQRASVGLAQDIFATFSSQIQLRTDVNIREDALTYVHSQFR